MVYCSTLETVNSGYCNYYLRIYIDKDARTITVRDNGIGMTKEEAEANLGVIAKSGSYKFKGEMDEQQGEDISIIGQFGVGFYSAFMVSDKVTVLTKKFGEEKGVQWESTGADGYTVTEIDKYETGTDVIMHIKEDTDEEIYGSYLEVWKLKALIKKYSDYVRWPIVMDITRQEQQETEEKDKDGKPVMQTVTITAPETVNSMVPIWQRSKTDVTDDDCAEWYKETYRDTNDPSIVLRVNAEGTVSYKALLFVPGKDIDNALNSVADKKGIKLYCNGVLIMENCDKLVHNYFEFVRGVVDSPDLSLNISRELLQHDRQLKAIAKGIEKKIGSELAKLLGSDREKYEQFFKAFGRQLKFGLYSDYGAHKDVLKDLILFTSSKEDKPVTLKEYTERMGEEQKKIFYAPGETLEQIKLLPQVEAVLAKGYEVLFLTEDVDEFALQILHEYDGKEFSNVCRDDLDLGTDEEKAELKTANDVNAAMLTFLRDQIGAVSAVRFTNSLKNHPACLSTEGEISVEMEKTLNKMPGVDEAPVKAELVLEINLAHPIADTLRELYNSDLDKLGRYAKILYAQARLISGLSLENPGEIGDMVVELMV